MSRCGLLVGSLAFLAMLRVGSASADAGATATTASPQQASPFARYFMPGSDDALVSPLYRSSRRQRGDFDPIDLLVLVHNPEWEQALRFMVQRALTRVAVQVLIPKGDSGAADFRAWSKERCIDLRDARLNTPWIRDYGPLQVFDGRAVTWLDYGYYADRQLDDTLPAELASRYQVRVENEARHVDGGGLISNGRGLCAMTDASLADAGMHLLERPALERFAAELGCHGLAVLPSLREEQTGHADVLAQFLAPDLVAVASMDAEPAPVYAELLDLAVGSLRRVARALGQPLHVVRVPMSAKGDVFYSYLNAVRVADLLFVPDYHEIDPGAQAVALGELHAALPEITLVPVPADAMVALGGAIHCVALGLNLPEPSAQRACAPSRTPGPLVKPLTRGKHRPTNRAHL